MVKGLERFREHFKGHEASYALIGGAACDILFGEAGLPFREPRRDYRSPVSVTLAVTGLKNRVSAIVANGTTLVTAEVRMMVAVRAARSERVRR